MKITKPALHCDINNQMFPGMVRPGSSGGQEPPKNSLSPPSAFELLKIAMHRRRHFRNLLVIFLESFFEFWPIRKVWSVKIFCLLPSL